MKSKYIFLLPLFYLFYFCEQKSNEIDISINSKIKLDTIYVSDIITEKNIVKIGKNKERKTIQLDYPTIANIRSKNSNKNYYTILTKNIDIEILSDSSLTTNNKTDSLFNYLVNSTIPFISKNNSFIFNTKNIDSIPILFEKFRT